MKNIRKKSTMVALSLPNAFLSLSALASGVGHGGPSGKF